MPRQADLVKRRQIAQRAIEVIHERGVHRTSMSDLAKALGMKRPTLYWYFKDLGEVLDAAIDLTYQDLAAFVGQRIPEAGHPIELLERLLAANLEFIQKHADRIMVMVQLWASTSAAEPERTIAKSRVFLAPFRVSLVHRVQAGIEAGDVVPCDPEGVVDAVLAMGDGAMIQYMVHGIDLDRLARTAMELLRGFRRDRWQQQQGG